MATEALAAVSDLQLVPAGVAVALPGIVEAQTGTLLWAPNLGWSEILVADEIAARLPDLPHLAVRAENESNLAALAEHWQGVARDAENFVCVFGEIGVGGGIFIDGELFRGSHGFGGEFGHITVDPDRPAVQVRLGRLSRDVRRARGDHPAGRHRDRRRRPRAQHHRGARPARRGRRRGRDRRASPRPAATSDSASARS